MVASGPKTSSIYTAISIKHCCMMGRQTMDHSIYSYCMVHMLCICITW